MRARPREWHQLRVLGGRTGLGKTAMLHALKAAGEQVLDLEGLAEHMGSAFGRVGQRLPQPSNEMYENLVGLAWRRADASRPLWVEHEGRHVGTCLVPLRVFEAIRRPPLLVMLDVPRAARVRHLVRIYSQIDTAAAPPRQAEEHNDGDRAEEAAAVAIGDTSTGGDTGGVQAAVVAELAASVESLRKRRGGAATATALEQLARGDFASVADSALEYYDGLYDAYAASSQREHVLHVQCAEAGQPSDAQRVFEMAKGVERGVAGALK